MRELTELQWSGLVASGADAATFLQGQLTQDVSALTVAGAWSFVLAPNGEVVSLVHVTPHAEGFLLMMPSDLFEVTERRLRRFLLRVDCALTPIPSPKGPLATPQELAASGMPWTPELALSLPPHSFGRRVLDATVSFTKGCFTGQELVGRADARGATMPWRFVGGRAHDVDVVDALLRSVGPEGPQGVSSVILSDDEFHWRGIAHRTLFDAPSWPPTEGVLDFSS